MEEPTISTRRSFMSTAGTGLLSTGLGLQTPLQASEVAGQSAMQKFGPVRQILAGELDVAYIEAGPTNGRPVLLLHGFPYSVDSYSEVIPELATRGCRVIAPFLRGHGHTRFVKHGEARSGQQAAIGLDVVALLDALKMPRAVLAGYDWGGRAACVVAALWPERCAGLVSVNGYLIQDIAKAGLPALPKVESGLWYQFYFQTERGRAGLTANRKEIARTLWLRNSPSWRFNERTLDNHAEAFNNPDYVEVVIHSYRHRLGTAPGYPAYDPVEQRLALQPAIAVPSITLDGKADGVVPATDGSSSAAKFQGPRSHRVVDGAGHNLPEEAPREFTNAVWELASR